MAANGFAVQIRDTDDLTSIKAAQGVPSELQSCHTAIVDGYIVEGHVPAADIQRLLRERPQVRGLAVPGMPVGSPGMELQGAAADPYDVIAFAEGGKSSIFASYKP